MKNIFRLLQIIFLFFKYDIDKCLIKSELLGNKKYLLFLFPWNIITINKNINLAVNMRMICEDLGPIFVKLGQMISTRKDLLSDDIAAELSKLQDHVTPFDGATAKKIIENELNEKTDDIFSSFETKPMASASIAQVHPAKLKSGEDVIVKVVRPDIKTKIDQDLSLMKRIATYLDGLSDDFKRMHLIDIVNDYEIIDQANLEIPSSDQFANENLSKSGKKSITVPLGSTNITNKINSLVIIIRSYTFGDTDQNQVMLDQSKKRIFDAPKIEYTLRTIKSVIRSSERAKKFFKDLKIKILITDDKSSDENLSRINKILEVSDIESKIININQNEFIDEISATDTEGKEISKNMISNMRNILKSIQIAENENSDLFYFLEDDYLHRENSANILLEGFELGGDYVTLYDHPDKYMSPEMGGNKRNVDGPEETRVYCSKSTHWKLTNSTTLTFASKVKTLKEDESIIRKYTNGFHPETHQKTGAAYDHSLWVHGLINNGRRLLSPIPGYSTHGEIPWMSNFINWENE